MRDERMKRENDRPASRIQLGLVAMPRPITFFHPSYFIALGHPVPYP